MAIIANVDKDIGLLGTVGIGQLVGSLALRYPIVLTAALPVVGLGLIFNAAYGIVLHAHGVAVLVVSAPVAALGFCQPVQVVVLVMGYSEAPPIRLLVGIGATFFRLRMLFTLL